MLFFFFNPENILELEPISYHLDIYNLEYLKDIQINYKKKKKPK